MDRVMVKVRGWIRVREELQIGLLLGLETSLVLEIQLRLG